MRAIMFSRLHVVIFSLVAYERTAGGSFCQEDKQ